MAQSTLRTGPNLVLKVSYADSPEKTVGYAQSINFSVSQGQKAIYTVDSPFIQELAQGAAPSMVSGSVTLFMPKGSDPVRAGLAVPTVDFNATDDPLMVTSRYLNWRFYDRYTSELAFAVNFVKVSNWSTSISAKAVVQVNLNFEGLFYETGIS